MIRWASFYDATVNIMTLGHARHLRSLTVDQALFKPGESVLDVGCGTGAVTIPAKMKVGNKGSAFGIDPAPEMIAVAQRKAKQAGLDIDFRVGAIESLPFSDATFDVVTSSLMMHHLTDNLRVKGPRIGFSYDGKILPLEYQEVGHHFCCGFSSNNPYVGEEAAHFFGNRAGVWYYVVVKFK